MLDHVDKMENHFHIYRLSKILGLTNRIYLARYKKESQCYRNKKRYFLFYHFSCFLLCVRSISPLASPLSLSLTRFPLPASNVHDCRIFLCSLENGECILLFFFEILWKETQQRPHRQRLDVVHLVPS